MSSQFQFVSGSGRNLEEPLEAVAPIFKATRSGGLEFVGTGFFVTNFGAMFTAAHVVLEQREPYDLYVFHKDVLSDAHVLRRAVGTRAHTSVDIAVIQLDPMAPDRNPNPIRTRRCNLTTEIPPVGARIGCWGFPQTLVMPPPHSGFDGTMALLERGEAIGTIELHLADGRDRVLQPGECIQTSMNTQGGSSGGPVFDESGRVFAVVSSGIEDHTTYVAPIREAATAKFCASPDGTPISLLEYLAIWKSMAPPE